MTKTKTESMELVRMYERTCSLMGEVFLKKHFRSKPDAHWVASEIGGILQANDYFFEMGDIVDFFRYDYSTKKMFEYYEYDLDCYYKGVSPINIRDYRYIKNVKKLKK